MVALLALLAAPVAATAQGGRIAGAVTDSAKRPLDDAQISIVGTRHGAFTDAQGRYAVVGVPAGTYAVRVQRLGSLVAVVPNVSVSLGGEARVDVTLGTAAVRLGGVVVSASRRAEKITDAPATITRIDAAAIQNTVGNSFAPALKDVKGLDFVQVGVTAVAVNARGFNSAFNNRMLMMEDNRIAVLPENASGWRLHPHLEGGPGEHRSAGRAGLSALRSRCFQWSDHAPDERSARISGDDDRGRRWQPQLL